MIDESAREKETGWDDQSGSYLVWHGCWPATNEDDVLAYQTNATTSETYFLCLFLKEKSKKLAGERVKKWRGKFSEAFLSR